MPITQASSRFRRVRPVPALLLALAALAALLIPAGARRTGLQARESTPPGAGPAGAATENPSIDRHEAIFDAFYRTGLETAAPLAVSDLTLRKDSLNLRFKQGVLFLMKPIAGEVTGAVFLGDGVATMTPPNTTERYMLKKYSGKPALDEPFTEAVLRFSDGTAGILKTAARPDPALAGQADAAAKIFSERNSWLNGDRNLQLEMQFLENRISGLKDQDFFLADLHTRQHDWLTYRFNPQQINENSLAVTESMGGGDRRYHVIWADWHRASEYGPKGHYLMNPDRAGPRIIRITHNDMLLNIPNTKTAEWDATLTIEPLVNGIRCLRLDLDNNGDGRTTWNDDKFYPIRLQSVTAEDGSALPFMHRRDQVLILLPVPAPAGKPFKISFKGTGEVIYQVTAESYGLLQASWYPRYGYLGGRSSFHWTVRVPRPFLVTGSGQIIREFEDKAAGQNGIETKCDLPVNFPWVIFGRFQKASDSYVSEISKRTIPLTIHSFPTMTTPITDKRTLDFFGLRTPVTVTLSAPVKKLQDFFDEAKQIFKTYETIYGPYPFDELHIAQMAPQLSFGQAPQGFLQLWGVAFMSQAQASQLVRAGAGDFVHGFFAHEIAHQWWGHQIAWASGDDEWLSEGFSEYASGIFVDALQGSKRFQGTLTEWRRKAKLADREAPIAAANTLHGPNAFDYRTWLLYAKAPYVLHMLRVQLDNDKYAEVMRSVQEKYSHRNITTEMLLAEVNRVTRSDYTSFFDQWFWDVGIPTFHYSWRSERQPDGKYLIIVNVSQEDREHVKKVLMPVHIHLKGKTIPQYRPVVEAVQEIKILSPIEPKDVTLDDDRTLLAEFVKAG